MENKSNKRKRAKITTEVIEEIQKLENEGLTNR
jgi:hypothetical protein